MSKPNIRAVVRNAVGEHLFALETVEDIEVYELLAERGQVGRYTKTKKGRSCIIFKLKQQSLPDVSPSHSKNSSCELTPADMVGLAGMEFAEAHTTRFQIERWIGYGLLPVRVHA